MKANELRNKSAEELKAELLNLSEQQFKLNIRKATGQLSQTHLLQATKREIARVKTMLTQKAGN